MRKKALCALLSVAMMASMFTACGSDDKKEEGTTSPTKGTEEGKKDEGKEGDENKPVEEDTTDWKVSDDGKVLNIYCWNEEFKSRLTDHYPGYEATDGTTGKIGDVTVNWIITPSDDNAYQNKLDDTLPKNVDAKADDKVDIFLVEADYALKYVDEDVTLPVEELGLTDADVADQYEYTKQIVTASTGKLKGVSWQACPAIMYYNRAAAKEVLGSDDPETVQAAVADWDKFVEVAEKMNGAGYKVCATVNDTYRVYSNNVSKPWVDGTKLQLDDNIKKWVDDSKKLVDAGYTTTEALWSDAWSKGFFPEGKVFSYFGPAWFINFSMTPSNDDGSLVDGSISKDGGWGACVGPQSFFWGGTWICAANGTDNKSLVLDIMKQLTCNADIMKEIVTADSDFVNNKPAMEEMAKDPNQANPYLGGQNPLPLYVEGVEKVDLSNLSSYDQGCTEEFQTAMKDYFDGNSTYEEALAAFAEAVSVKYPSLDVSAFEE